MRWVAQVRKRFATDARRKPHLHVRLGVELELDDEQTRDHAHNNEVGHGDTELDLFSGIRSSKSVTRGRDGGRLPFSRSVEWGYRYGEFVNHSVGNNHQDPRVRCTSHECTAQARLRGTPAVGWRATLAEWSDCAVLVGFATQCLGLSCEFEASLHRSVH